ncbi:MAG: CHAT domain-containing protein [Holophagales bacterium]|nr:CHAT domain-containing protein [Holophagales bacterium]
MNEGGQPNAAGEKAVPDRFADFDLSIERAGDGYRARVTESPEGPRRPMALDLSALDLHAAEEPGVGTGAPSDTDAALEAPREVRRRAPDRSELQIQGERLFRAVFTGEVGSCFRASVAKQRERGEGLLVRLHFEEAAELAQLPWEALWDPTERAFFADLSDLPIARGLDVPAEAPRVVASGPPLHVLALLPRPRGEAELSGEEEWRRIREHLRDLVEAEQVVTDQVEPPTLQALGHRLRSAPCDVLHLVAHGEPGGPDAGGQLRLESSSGGADPISAGDLTRALERRRPPRLVVLSACHGARTTPGDVFDGLAQHLLSRGVPAVVAMRSSISDPAAVAFASALYRELAAGYTLERAMVEARAHLSLGQHRAEWATPVLYLRGANIRLFDTLLLPRLGDRRPAGLLRRPALLGAGAALLGLVAAGIVLLTAGDAPTACPPPPGLEDLTFVRIDSGVTHLDGRDLVIDTPFCMATRELSRRDWHTVMGPESRSRDELPGDHPKTHVTIAEARELAARLTARDSGRVYRLPDADEWEYAARADVASAYFFGDDPRQLAAYGNCRNRLANDGHDRTAPVGSFRPNPWGLYDVHGNVAEWVEWPEREGDPRLDGVELGLDDRLEKFDREKRYFLALRLGGSADNVPRNCAFEASWSEVKRDEPHRADTGIRLLRELENPPAGGD